MHKECHSIDKKVSLTLFVIINFAARAVFLYAADEREYALNAWYIVIACTGLFFVIYTYGTYVIISDKFFDRSLYFWGQVEVEIKSIIAIAIDSSKDMNFGRERCSDNVFKRRKEGSVSLAVKFVSSLGR